MKKFLMLLLMLCIALVFPLLATAEAVTAPLAGTAFFDWATLGTFAGAVAATVFIVQLLKLPLDKVWKIPTRAVCYLIALVLMVAAMIFTKGWDWEQFVLCLFNAALVALSAMSTYEVAIGGVEEHKLAVDAIPWALLDSTSESTQTDADLDQNGAN